MSSIVCIKVENINVNNESDDMRQWLNRMVKKYAGDRCLHFGVAWKDFIKTFNDTYQTDLKQLITDYERESNLKKVTVPQYLSATGKLEDGIKVASILMNQTMVN